MAPGRWLASLLLTTMLLAGCSSSPAPGTAPQADAPTPGAEADFTELQLEATKTTGVLRGVVVDTAVRPLAGANVTVHPGALQAFADGQGRFGFEGLEPGSYVVRAEAVDFIGQQATVTVVAGDDAPTPVVLSLEAVLGTEPYVDAFAWDGYMQCSLIAAGFFFTGCMASDYTEDDSRKEDFVARLPDFLQSELHWDSTQALGDNLCMKHYARRDSDFEPITDTQGRSAQACGGVPVIQAFDQAHLNATHVGGERGIERVVWVDYAVPQALGMAMNQRFSLYTHVFHNFLPAEGWTFGKDGAPTPPA